MALTEIAQSSSSAINSGSTIYQSSRDTLDNWANSYIVQPKGLSGIGGFIFSYEGDSTISMQAEITDHYLESNLTVQDHVAIKPLRWILRGYVGELVDRSQQGVTGALSTIQNRLGTVPAYLGKYTPQSLSKIQGVITKSQSIVNQIDNAIKNTSNLLKYAGLIVQGRSEQQKAYVTLSGYFNNRRILRVVSPYGVLNNMVIESLQFVQDENTTQWSDITVTLKQLRFANSTIITLPPSANSAQQQAALPVDKGQITGSAASLDKVLGAFS